MIGTQLFDINIFCCKIITEIMADIIDNEEVDKDTVDPETLKQLFNQNYDLLTETTVSVKKSYVNTLDGTKSLKLAAGVSNNNGIEVYELHNSALRLVCKLSGHKKSLTEVVFSPREDHMLYSSGLDGLVKLWDLRASGSCVQEYKDDDEQISRPYECMDVSCNGRVLCAGSQVVEDDAFLVFFDSRMPKPLGGYWNSHTDDITQVKFNKEKTEILATGSLDGLLNIFNVLEQTEDDALTYSFNIENSIDKITWLDNKNVACTTQSNDMQCWNTETGDLVKNCTRDKISRSIKRSKEDDCYLVDIYTSIDNTPVILAGSNAGTGNVLRSVAMTGKKLQPCTNFIQNKQIVRCCWYEKDRDILVTTGESGAIDVWSRAATTDLDSHKLSNSLDKLRVNRFKPY